ncbi:MAG: hypothetical protein A3I32_02460 [Candidatus Yanofskybacteria bacterium RIFCSPLOWO2_02_FULL_45_10]|uniref:Uncharacterized protein n=1 Tax=Candidatus Yanofskybacteria bacterium RIFCSPLOWO2_02_FULL_45_10 TaxID=1802706 RepID=A0A1F8H5H2_9BACT|nr:MAG: hypothetical protein A3I32_02460 [Candidatus Yanofskybacteria bacterium RIFCSPLOWO2_02_FULL_45_10]
MANRKISFINDNYYHIYNRGIDKRIIFENDHDFKRFQESLRLFNSPNSIWLADANQKTEVKPQDRLTSRPSGRYSVLLSNAQSFPSFT